MPSERPPAPAPAPVPVSRPAPASVSRPVPATTIEDVARAAGVSRQTVSNTINSPERVRPETLSRVQAAIDALGYRPNRAARSLRSRATRMLGYRIEPVRPDAVSPVLDRFLHALADAAKDDGYHLLLFTAGPDDEQTTYAELVRSAVVDGFVISGTDHADPRPKWLLELGVGFVAFGRTDRDDHPWVDVDNAAGTTAVVEHLVERGHRRIAFLGWPEGSVTGDARADGWRATLALHGLDATGLDPRDLDTVESGVRLAAHLLDSADPPTAYVCVSDVLALGALQTLTARGVAVGAGGVAVTGFDDTPTAALVSPSLTSVRQPLEEVGRTVIRLLTGTLAGHAATPGVLLEPALVVRHSS